MACICEISAPATKAFSPAPVRIATAPRNLHRIEADETSASSSDDHNLVCKVDHGPAAGVFSMVRSRWSLQTAKSDRMLGVQRTSTNTSTT